MYLVDDLTEVTETQDPDGSFFNFTDSDALTTWLVYGDHKRNDNSQISASSRAGATEN